MNRLRPGKTELFVMAVAALLCGAIVTLAGQTDLAMATLAVPLFFGAAMLGLWRSGKLAELSGNDPDEKAP